MADYMTTSWSPDWLIAGLQCFSPIFNLPSEEGFNSDSWVERRKRFTGSKLSGIRYRNYVLHRPPCKLCFPSSGHFLLSSAGPNEQRHPPFSVFVSFTLFTVLAPRPAITSLHHSFAALSLSVLFPSFISSPAVMSKGQGVSSPTSCCQCSCLLLRYLLALAFSCCPNEQAAQH